MYVGYGKYTILNLSTLLRLKAKMLTMVALVMTALVVRQWQQQVLCVIKPLGSVRLHTLLHQGLRFKEDLYKYAYAV